MRTSVNMHTYGGALIVLGALTLAQSCWPLELPLPKLALCPGAPISLNLNSAKNVDIAISGESTTYRMSCANSDYNDSVAFQVSPNSHGIMSVALGGSVSVTGNASISISCECGNIGTEVVCEHGAGPAAIAVAAGQSYYVLVQSPNITYAHVEFSLNAGFCGDGVLQLSEGACSSIADESCDENSSCTEECDGQDGCTNQCTWAGPSEQCLGPTGTVDLVSGEMANWMLDTSGKLNDWTEGCQPGIPADGHDIVVNVRTPGSGTLDVSLDGQGKDAVLAIFTVCGDDQSLDGLLACADDPLDGTVIESVTLPTPAEPAVYFLVVDGQSVSDNGVYNLDVLFTSSE